MARASSSSFGHSNLAGQLGRRNFQFAPRSVHPAVACPCSCRAASGSQPRVEGISVGLLTEHRFRHTAHAHCAIRAEATRVHLPVPRRIWRAASRSGRRAAARCACVASVYRTTSRSSCRDSDESMTSSTSSCARPSTTTPTPCWSSLRRSRCHPWRAAHMRLSGSSTSTLRTRSPSCMLATHASQAGDRRWIIEHPTSLAEIEKATMRVVALRMSRHLSEAAERLGMAPVSL